MTDSGLKHIHAQHHAGQQEYTYFLLAVAASTAAPTATEVGVEVASYDPRDLPGFAAHLLATPGRHLVVGHSNTTPEMVEALGGDPGSPIEEFEYDRIYVVVASDDGVETILLRFGERFHP